MGPGMRFSLTAGTAMTFTNTMNDVQRGFEAVAVLVLVVGIAGGFAIAARDLGRGSPEIYEHLRSFVGRTILLGLEIFVAADLIRTVAVDPSIENVGVLALIVLIRTFLSLSLDIEIEGQLPWRPREDGVGDFAALTWLSPAQQLQCQPRLKDGRPSDWTGSPCTWHTMCP